MGHERVTIECNIRSPPLNWSWEAQHWDGHEEPTIKSEITKITIEWGLRCLPLNWTPLNGAREARY